MRYKRQIRRRQTRRTVRRRIQRQKIALVVLTAMLGVTAILCGGIMLKKRLPQEARASEKKDAAVYLENDYNNSVGMESSKGLEKDQEGNNFENSQPENTTNTSGNSGQAQNESWAKITASPVPTESISSKADINQEKEMEKRELENHEGQQEIDSGKKIEEDSNNTGETEQKIEKEEDARKETGQGTEDSQKKDSENSNKKSEETSSSQDKTERSKRIKELEEQLEERIKTTAFIGNSRTEGLQMNNKSCKADFFCYRGLMVNTAGKKDLMELKNGKKGTVLDALKEGSYTDIFIMFGVNELGWKSTEIFRDYYVELIEDIKKQQPKANIYVQSILPVTKKTSKSDKIYNNTNVKLFNAMVVEAAEKTEVIYLDVAAELCGKGNPLPSEAAGKDGIHLTKEYCERWYEYLLEQMMEY